METTSSTEYALSGRPPAVVFFSTIDTEQQVQAVP